MNIYVKSHALTMRPFLFRFYEIKYWNAVDRLEKLGKWRLLLNYNKDYWKMCFLTHRNLYFCMLFSQLLLDVIQPKFYMVIMLGCSYLEFVTGKFGTNLEKDIAGHFSRLHYTLGSWICDSQMKMHLYLRYTNSCFIFWLENRS